MILHVHTTRFHFAYYITCNITWKYITRFTRSLGSRLYAEENLLRWKSNPKKSVRKKEKKKKEEEARTRVTREGWMAGTNEGNTMILTAMFLSGNDVCRTFMDQGDQAGSGHFSTDLLWRITQEAGRVTEKIERERTERRRAIEGNVREWCPTSLMLSRAPAGAAILPFSLSWPRFRNFSRVLFFAARAKESRRISRRKLTRGNSETRTVCMIVFTKESRWNRIVSGKKNLDSNAKWRRVYVFWSLTIRINWNGIEDKSVE